MIFLDINLINILFKVQYLCTLTLQYIWGVKNMFPKRLKKIRQNKGLTQERLAKLVNTKKTTISNYETSYSSPSNEMLKDLAQVLNTSTDFLLGLTDNPNPYKVKGGGKDIELTPEEYKVLIQMREHSEFAKIFYELVLSPEKKWQQFIKMWEILKDSE